MRFLKLASAKNPENDFILLDGGYYDKDGNKDATFFGFNGFICTSFQSLGIDRKLEFLAIKNRQFTVENKPEFKKYSLKIEILSKYSEYEGKYNELITFIDRNKKDGFRLYYRPYGDDKDRIRYCLCDIESLSKNEKLQPIVLSLSQCSLWFREVKRKDTAYNTEDNDLFAFKSDTVKNDDESINDKYYSISFSLDEDVGNYYCVYFNTNIETQASIKNECYNEIPLNFRIYGPCVNPVVSLFKKGEKEAIRTLELDASIDNGYYIEVNASIFENGVWYVEKETGKKMPYDDRVKNEHGSPYFYIDNGEYVVTVEDRGGNVCEVSVFWQEEYNE